MRGSGEAVDVADNVVVRARSEMLLRLAAASGELRRGIRSLLLNLAASSRHVIVLGTLHSSQGAFLWSLGAEVLTCPVSSDQALP